MLNCIIKFQLNFSIADYNSNLLMRQTPTLNVPLNSPVKSLFRVQQVAK